MKNYFFKKFIYMIVIVFISTPLLSRAGVSMCPITYPNTNLSLSDVELYDMEKGDSPSQEIDIPVKLKNGLAYSGWVLINDPRPNFWEEAICYYQGTKKTLHVKIPKGKYTFCGVPTYNTPKTPLMTFKCFTAKEYIYTPP